MFMVPIVGLKRRSRVCMSGRASPEMRVVGALANDFELVSSSIVFSLSCNKEILSVD